MATKPAKNEVNRKAAAKRVRAKASSSIPNVETPIAGELPLTAVTDKNFGATGVRGPSPLKPEFGLSSGAH